MGYSFQCLLVDPAAIDDVGLAGREGGFIACEVKSQLGDLFWLTQPAHRLARGEARTRRALKKPGALRRAFMRQKMRNQNLIMSERVSVDRWATPGAVAKWNATYCSWKIVSADMRSTGTITSMPMKAAALPVYDVWIGEMNKLGRNGKQMFADLQAIVGLLADDDHRPREGPGVLELRHEGAAADLHVEDQRPGPGLPGCVHPRHRDGVAGAVDRDKEGARLGVDGQLRAASRPSPQQPAFTPPAKPPAAENPQSSTEMCPRYRRPR